MLREGQAMPSAAEPSRRAAEPPDIYFASFSPACQLSLSSRNKANTLKPSLLRKIRGNIGRKYFKILTVVIFGWMECG